MVVKRAQITLCIRIKTLVKQFCNNLALDFERTRGNIHKPVKTAEEVLFVCRKVGYARHIDCNNADRAGAFAAAEEAAGFLSQLAEVKTKAAAHTADVARLHFAVDVI